MVLTAGVRLVDDAGGLRYATLCSPSESKEQMIQIKRVYEPPARADGFRILVDRLWPRGLSKKVASAHLWLREIAPSAALRKWFAHRPERWPAFQRRYKKELESRKELLEQICEAEREHGTVTLLFAASDTERNNAVVLRALLRKRRP